MAIMQRLECGAVQNPTNLDLDKDVVILNRVRRIRQWHARHAMECPVVRSSFWDTNLLKKSERGGGRRRKMKKMKIKESLFYYLFSTC